MKVYVYKEYCDTDAYGEELIRLFEDFGDAKRFLKKQVESYFGTEWENIPIDPDDTFEEDYVSIYDGNGATFWIIESYETIKKGSN